MLLHLFLFFRKENTGVVRIRSPTKFNSFKLVIEILSPFYFRKESRNERREIKNQRKFSR